MSKFLILSVVALGAAIVFGFLSAAAMATDLGMVVAAALAALIALSVTFQGTHLFET